MAVDKIPSGSILRMQFQTGLDGEGNPIFRTKNISNVKPMLQTRTFSTWPRPWLTCRSTP